MASLIKSSQNPGSCSSLAAAGTQGQLLNADTGIQMYIQESLHPQLAAASGVCHSWDLAIRGIATEQLRRGITPYGNLGRQNVITQTEIESGHRHCYRLQKVAWHL